MTISIFVIFMLAANCSLATIASSSMGYADSAPMALPSLMFVHSSGDCFLSLLSSNGGAMMMLACADILSGCASSLSARNLSSHTWLLLFI